MNAIPDIVDSNPGTMCVCMCVLLFVCLSAYVRAYKRGVACQNRCEITNVDSSAGRRLKHGSLKHSSGLTQHLKVRETRGASGI